MGESKRFLKEIIIPFLVSLIIVSLYIVVVNDNESLAKRITSINSTISTVIAIQVGFNITCLALIASFGNKTAEQTFKTATDEERLASMNQIISSYIYGVTVYFIVLLLGVLHLTLVEPLSIANGYDAIPPIWFMILKISYFFAWCFFILHGFAVFLRNAILIQLYLLVNIKRG